jgi:hypothetical protein
MYGGGGGGHVSISRLKSEIVQRPSDVEKSLQFF